MHRSQWQTRCFRVPHQSDVIDERQMRAIHRHVSRLYRRGQGMQDNADFNALAAILELKNSQHGFGRSTLGLHDINRGDDRPRHKRDGRHQFRVADISRRPQSASLRNATTVGGQNLKEVAAAGSPALLQDTYEILQSDKVSPPVEG